MNSIFELATPDKANFTQLLIQAGAGAGKTTELVSRILALLAHPTPGKAPPKIAVTTFTRKATEELRERILFAASSFHDPSLLKLCQDTSQLWITTIHGIYAEIVRDYGHLLGWDRQVEIIEEYQAFEWKKSTFFQFLEETGSASYAPFLAEFRFEEILEIIDSFRFFEMRAEASQTLTAEVHRDFRKAAQVQLRGDLDSFFSSAQGLKLTPKQTESIEILKAIHSRMVRDEDFLAEWRSLSGFRAPKDLASDWTLLKEKLIHVSAEEYSEAFLAKHQDVVASFVAFFRAYDAFELRAMRRAQILTQDALERLACELLQNFSEVRERVTWDVWLIDEYQDTSELQEHFLELLTRGKKTFVVGDPQQSIYFFRGADVGVFENKKEKTATFEIRSRNYRSTPGLVRFFNSFFGFINPEALQMEAHRETEAHDFDLSFYEGDDVGANLRTALEELSQTQGSKAVLCRKNSEVVGLSNLLSGLGIQNLTSGGSFSKRRFVQDAVNLLEWCLAPNDHEIVISLLRSPWIDIEDEEILNLIRARKLSGKTWSFHLRQLPRISSSAKVLEVLLDKRSEESILDLWIWALRELAFFSSAAAIDPSGKVECSLWQLIHFFETEERKPGFQIYEAIRQIQFQKISPTPLHLHEDAIQVMTIHAAKGLEFDHVLLPHLEKSIRSLQAPLFVSATDQQLWALRIRSETSDSAKTTFPYFRKTLELQKQTEKGESLRVLYVAMTRAKRSLRFVSTTDPEKSSWSAQLLEFMDVHTDAIRRVHVEKNESGPASFHVFDDSKSAAVAQEREISFVSSRAPHSNAEDLSSRLALTPAVVDRIQTGLQFHQKVYRLRSSAIELPEFSFLRSGEVPFEKIFREGRFEWPFTLWNPFTKSLENGRIDLWAEVGAAVWIVDYKTGDFFDELNFDQLKKYKDALTKVFEFSNRSFYGVYIQPQRQKVRVTQL